MGVSSALRRLDEGHAARPGRSFELLLLHGTADGCGGDAATPAAPTDGHAATRRALAAGAFSLHARGASAAASLLERRAALLLDPSSTTYLTEPELALRLLLALVHSADPAICTAHLMGVMQRHGMHAIGRAAPGGSGAMRVHELPFGVRARAVGAIADAGERGTGVAALGTGSGTSPPAKSSCALVPRGASGSGGSSAERGRHPDARSNSTGVGPLEGLGGGLGGRSAGAALLLSRLNLYTAASALAPRDAGGTPLGAGRKRAAAPVPIWAAPAAAPLALATSPPPRNLKPPPLPGSSGSAGSRPRATGGVGGGGGPRPLGLSAGDDDEAAAARDVLRALQGACDSSVAYWGRDGAAGSAPPSLSLSVAASLDRAGALAGLCAALRGGGWGAVGRALAVAIAAR